VLLKLRSVLAIASVVCALAAGGSVFGQHPPGNGPETVSPELAAILLTGSDASPYAVVEERSRPWPYAQDPREPLEVLRRPAVEQFLSRGGYPDVRVVYSSFETVREASEAAVFYAGFTQSVWRECPPGERLVGEECWLGESPSVTALLFRRGRYCVFLSTRMPAPLGREVLAPPARAIDLRIQARLAQESSPGLTPPVLACPPEMPRVRATGARGKVWVWARAAAEGAGVTVAWRGESREAVFAREACVLVVRPEEPVAALNDQPFPLEAAPYIENDRLILPLSALAQAFGLTLTEAQVEQVTCRMSE